MTRRNTLESDLSHHDDAEIELTIAQRFTGSSSHGDFIRQQFDAIEDDPQCTLNSSTPSFSRCLTNSESSADLVRYHVGHREHSHYDTTPDEGLLEPLVTRRTTHKYRSAAFSEAMPSWRVSTLSKLLVIPAILVPLVVSALLLWARKRHWYITGPPLIFISAHRGAIQTVVQIFSHLLGALQVYVLCNVIAFSVRIYLVRTYISLKYLKFFSALVSHRFDLGLPSSLLFQLVLFNLLNLVPSALWAGSITPIITTSYLTGTTAIAHFGQDSAGYWGAAPFDYWNCSTKVNNQGRFSNCPGLHTPNGLLATISMASTSTGAVRNSTKNDNTQFVYIGRSYGMGSSVGLVPLRTRLSLLLVDNYEYAEYGYKTSVVCIYNSSSTWSRRLQVPGVSKGGIPGIFYAIGYLPNSDLSIPPPFYSIVGWGDQDIVAYQSDSNMGRFLYAFTAGQGYASLGQMQCEVSFTSCKYNVVVSPPGKNITVTPAAQCGGADAMDVDPTGRLKSKVVGEVAWLPRVSTSLYRSLVGDAFVSNINTFNISLHSQALDANSTALLAVGASLAAAIDDALSALSSFQVITGFTTLVPVNVTIQVLHFGDAWAIYAVVVLNVFILLVAAEEAVRTRFWAELPLFDFVDIKTCVLEAALGSSTIVKSIEENLGSGLWLGDGVEPRLDDIKVRLKVDATGMSLVGEANIGNGI